MWIIHFLSLFLDFNFRNVNEMPLLKNWKLKSRICVAVLLSLQVTSFFANVSLWQVVNFLILVCIGFNTNTLFIVSIHFLTRIHHKIWQKYFHFLGTRPQTLTRISFIITNYNRILNFIGKNDILESIQWWLSA